MAMEDKIVYTTQKDFPLSTIREMFDDGDIVTDIKTPRLIQFNYSTADFAA